MFYFSDHKLSFSVQLARGIKYMALEVVEGLTLGRVSIRFKAILLVQRSQQQ